MSAEERLPLQGNHGVSFKSPFFEPSTKRPKQVSSLNTSSGEDADEENKSSIPEASANLINAIVGAGIVGIPYAIREAGLVVGIFLTILTALLTEKSLRILIETAKFMKVPSYETIAEVSFSRSGFVFVSVNMFILSYGAMVSYLIVIKDTLPTVMGVGTDEDDLPLRRGILFLFSLFIIVPLSMQRDMADLAKTSSISCIFDISIVFLVVYLSPTSNLASFDEAMDPIIGPTNDIPQNGPLSTKVIDLLKDDIVHPKTVFVGLGVLSFAFVCQHSAFIIAGSLKTPTRARWANVTRLSISVCATLALTMGLGGYLGFGVNTQGNILNNLGESNGANLARLLLSSTMFFVYPMESFVARHVLVVLLFRGKVAHDGDDHAILARADRRRNLTLSLYAAAVIPAMIFPDLGTVLALTGCIGGSCLSFIGPGLVFLGVHGQKFLDLVDGSWLFKKESNSTEEEEEEEEEDDSTSVAENVCSLIRKVVGRVVYCVTLLPIWYSIAKLGAETRKAHEHKVSLATPHTKHRSLRGRISSPMPQKPSMPLRRSELDEERNLHTESRLLSPNISVDPKSRNTLDENKLLSPNRSLGKLYLTKLEPKKEEDDFKSWETSC
eukprot:CAMPEP_0116075854 /NCGR_PEP_ID=MMETSP0322-20121206/16882_1 /TAXON_ID=163516 /ORGANISM="Leptocylindrus danicus var. apora, Strain B651" /LENGTH=610 /DNA_ID=CAMNT_0003565991 /DNA_START=100 /DNA_END=1932 /DNA_ORIENTATION=+